MKRLNGNNYFFHWSFKSFAEAETGILAMITGQG
jgi:hypothetical protein